MTLDPSDINFKYGWVVLDEYDHKTIVGNFFVKASRASSQQRLGDKMPFRDFTIVVHGFA